MKHNTISIFKLTRSFTAMAFALLAMWIPQQILLADILQNDDVIIEGFACLSDSDVCVENQSNTINGFPDFDLIARDNFPGIALQGTGTSGVAWFLTNNFAAQQDFKITVNNPANTFINRLHIEDLGTSETELRIDSLGQVGINEKDPLAALDVKAITGQRAAVKVTNVGGANNAIHTIMNLASNGPPSLRLRDNFNDETWQFRAKQNGGFTMNNAGSPGLELEIEKDGRVKFRNSVFVNGVLVHSSSRELKENFDHVDPATILKKVDQLSIGRWNYKQDNERVKHLGPIAEEFYAAFNLGENDKGISSVDASGVALVAIQALKRELDQREQRIAELEQQVMALKNSQDRLATLEQVVQQLMEQGIGDVQLASAAQ